jgi:hypothetical protein
MSAVLAIAFEEKWRVHTTDVPHEYRIGIPRPPSAAIQMLDELLAENDLRREFHAIVLDEVAADETTTEQQLESVDGLLPKAPHCSIGLAPWPSFEPLPIGYGYDGPGDAYRFTFAAGTDDCVTYMELEALRLMKARAFVRAALARGLRAWGLVSHPATIMVDTELYPRESEALAQELCREVDVRPSAIGASIFNWTESARWNWGIPCGVAALNDCIVKVPDPPDEASGPSAAN